MAKLFRHFREKKKRVNVLREIINQDNFESLFWPYYLNDEKINNLFVQEYGGLEEFTKTRASEFATQLGGGIKNTSITALIAELKVEGKLARKKSSGQTEKYHIPTVLRFIFLRRYLMDQKRLLILKEANYEGLSKHTLVVHLGSYRFAESTKELKTLLTAPQINEIKDQKEFEEKSEGKHFLYLIKTPVLSVSIISDRFITYVGRRYLRHYSLSEEEDTLFIGAVIGFKHNILFLDPIAIGEEFSKK